MLSLAAVAVYLDGAGRESRNMRAAQPQGADDRVASEEIGATRTERAGARDPSYTSVPLSSADSRYQGGNL